MKYLKQSILLLLLKQATEVFGDDNYYTEDDDIALDDVPAGDDPIGDDAVVGDDIVAPIDSTPGRVKGTCTEEDSLVEVSSTLQMY